jgi:hypothetical protein
MKTMNCSAAYTRLPALIGMGLGLSLHAQSVIQFSATTYNVTEDTGQAEIIVQRTNDLNMVVSVDFATTNLSATPGLDYLDVATNLTFGAGETNLIIAVPILNDSLVEGMETFQAWLSSATGGAVLGTRTNATVRIADNDKGLSFEFANYWVREDEDLVLIGVVRGDDGNFPITVDVNTTDGTAQSGLDYTGATNTLSFAAGEKVKLFTVPILNDGLKEASETFRLYLTNAIGGAVLGTPRIATVTILDNDPGIGFQRNFVYAHEDQGGALLTVLRGNDQLLAPFQVEYAITNLTTSAEDHGGTNGVLEFAAGQMNQVLWIPVVADALAEVDERLQVTLRNPTGGLELGTASNATVTICDATGTVANRFASIEHLPNSALRLGLTAQLHSRFSPYYSLFPLETSRDLSVWEPLDLLSLANTVTPPLLVLDLDGASESQRFYRLAHTNLITPGLPPAGPYAVGKVGRLITDPTRRNRFQCSTNGSFPFWVWYPAVPRAGQVPAPMEDQPLALDPACWGTIS